MSMFSMFVESPPQTTPVNSVYYDSDPTPIVSENTWRPIVTYRDFPGDIHRRGSRPEMTRAEGPAARSHSGSTSPTEAELGIGCGSKYFS